MYLKNKEYKEFEIRTYKVPEFKIETKVENDVLYVSTINKKGSSFWIKAGNLQTKTKSNEKILDCLIWEMRNIRESLGLTKVEMKRKLVKAGVISR